MSRFPYLGRRDGGVRTSASLFKGASEAVLETADAGYINPRRLCLAEQRAAQSGGCHVIRDVVSDVVEDVATGNEAARMRIVTDGGLTLRARKVLIATGAFTDFRRLLPPGVRFDLEYLTQSVIFLEMSAEDLERTR